MKRFLIKLFALLPLLCPSAQAQEALPAGLVANGGSLSGLVQTQFGAEPVIADGWRAP